MSYLVKPLEYWADAGIPVLQMLSRPRGRKHLHCGYYDAIMAFDIETSKIGCESRDSMMYLWNWSIMIGNVIETCCGRTWEELIAWMYRVADVNRGLTVDGDAIHIVVYVHNLSYEFGYLVGTELPISNVFCLDSRKVLSCDITIGTTVYEMRDSYKLSNTTLDNWGRILEIPDRKRSSDDYGHDAIRYPHTKLHPAEYEYGQYDTVAVCECVDTLMRLRHDTLYTIPKTSTGYVRRMCKYAIMGKGGRLADIRKMLPDVRIYKKLRRAFRGGNTHASRMLAGKIVENVHNYDFSSDYPARLAIDKYPMTKFYRMRQFDKPKIDKIVEKRQYALLLEVEYYNIRLRHPFWPVPYISASKTEGFLYWRRGNDDICDHADNGRVLDAKHIKMTITDIDYAIIEKEYIYDKMEIKEVDFAEYASLPNDMRDIVNRLYVEKTELKGVEGKSVEYALKKEEINALYGMTAQDPGKFMTEFSKLVAENGGFYEKSGKEILLELINNYQLKGWLPYQWGVWTTAHARWELEKVIQIAYDQQCDVVYVDTDSCKVIGDVDYRGYNASMRAKAKKAGITGVDKNGKMHYGGVFERETDYYRFLTLGAKKYAYELKDPKTGDVSLHVTIAGVGKKDAPAELQKLENMLSSFKFEGKAGGLDSIYNDDSDYNITVDGYTYHVSRNITLVPSTYTLGEGKEYSELLDKYKNYKTLLQICIDSGEIMW